MSVFEFPAQSAAFSEELKSNTPQVVVAVGVEAARSIALERLNVPVVATMALRSDRRSASLLDGGSSTRLAGAALLDLSIAQLGSSIRSVFPDVTRIGVLRNPSQTSAAEVAAGKGSAAAGYTLRAADCRSPAELLPAFLSLHGQVDFVICLPDNLLYTRTTVEPMILASLERRLPLVGFSSNFVRAGAAFGVFPDFSDIGRQTAALAERCLAATSSPREEGPRRVALAVNSRVLRLIGRDLPGRNREDLLVLS